VIHEDLATSTIDKSLEPRLSASPIRVLESSKVLESLQGTESSEYRSQGLKQVLDARLATN
jgi:hypothetical protein